MFTVSRGTDLPGIRAAVAAGLHGSASTWVFNVARELMVAQHGAEQVCAVYAEAAAVAMTTAGRRRLVWKTHAGGPGFRDFAVREKPVILVSIRDPRDALVSMA